jgi:hypothetical protein
MTTLPKEIYRFNDISSKILMTLFTEKKENPKIHMASQNTQNSWNDLKQKNKTLEAL